MSNLHLTYEQYNLLHNNFIETYKIVNDYVTELYRLPKNFLDETKGYIHHFSSKQFAPKSPSNSDNSLREIVSFINQLDTFTLFTVELFNEHIKHIEESEDYLMQTATLKANLEISKEETAKSCLLLFSEVMRLMDGLKDIKQKADKTIIWLKQLEEEWEDVQERMRQAA